MKQQKNLTMIIEKTTNGFSAYSLEYPIFTTAKTIHELIVNAFEASRLYFDKERLKILFEFKDE